MSINSTVYKSAGACTDTTLPILYKDPAATSGTKFIYDALDTNSFAKQAAPTGTDVIKNLVSGADATFSGTVPGWAASGGFTYPGSGSGRILLPTSGKVASNQLTGFYFGVWVKTASVTGVHGIGGLSNGTPGSSQYLIYQDDAKFVFSANSLGAAVYNGSTINTVYHLAVAYRGDGAGNFTWLNYVNGVALGAPQTAAAASIFQPSAANPDLGGGGVTQSALTIYRTMFDDFSSGVSQAALVAADYNAGVGRFT